MGERGPIEGEFTELNSSNNNQITTTITIIKLSRKLHLLA